MDVEDGIALIVENMQADPFISITELAELLEVSRPTVLSRISLLRERGIVRRVGSPKTGHWEVLKEMNRETNR